MATNWRHGLGVGLAALGLLAAGSQLQGWLPAADEDPGAEPFLRTGAVGDAIDVRTATITVENVVGSRTVVEYGTELLSPGVWVVAHYTVVADRENTSITFAELEDDAGRVWDLGGRNGNACVASPPGLAAHCAVYVEVPPEALPSLRLRLAREAADTRYDAMAEVDLGLTGDDAAAFAVVEPVVIPAPALGDEPLS